MLRAQTPIAYGEFVNCDMFDLQQKTPLDKIEDDLLLSRQVNLYLKRDDLIHREISGNKWRKLKYNLMAAREQGCGTLLTFGGAFSNHIAATAAAAREYGFKAIGIIRGDELHPASNPTLQHAHELGMLLKFVSREEYKRKNEEHYLDQLKREYDDFYLIPEGGSNTLAVKGCKEIVREIDVDFQVIVSAVGTGGTLAGLVCGLPGQATALGISVLKGAGYLQEEVGRLVNMNSNEKRADWEINHEYHLGGYARFNDKLIEFINQFKAKHSIQLDPVYTGKMMMGIYDLINHNYFEPNTTIVALHTGGLQGVEGYNKLNKYKIE
ncbi:MAG: pyridoxal-phosphate dependent enzyme [Cyclobacteriaceae bacterium]